MSDYEDMEHKYYLANAEIKKLRTRVKKLEKDKARLDWMEDRQYVEATNTEAPGGHERPGVIWIRYHAENSLRNTIDDAMVTGE